MPQQKSIRTNLNIVQMRLFHRVAELITVLMQAVIILLQKAQDKTPQNKGRAYAQIIWKFKRFYSRWVRANYKIWLSIYKYRNKSSRAKRPKTKAEHTHPLYYHAGGGIGSIAWLMTDSRRTDYPFQKMNAPYGQDPAGQNAPTNRLDLLYNKSMNILAEHTHGIAYKNYALNPSGTFETSTMRSWDDETAHHEFSVLQKAGQNAPKQRQSIRTRQIQTQIMLWQEIIIMVQCMVLGILCICLKLIWTKQDKTPQNKGRAYAQNNVKSSVIRSGIKSNWNFALYIYRRRFYNIKSRTKRLQTINRERNKLCQGILKQMVLM